MLRRLWFAAPIAGLVIALPAGASKPLQARVAGFDLVQVNQEVIAVQPGGSHPLCQAIPITVIGVRLAWVRAHKDARLRLLFTIPGNGTRTRWVHTRPGTAGLRVKFSPQKLPAKAFPGGRYTATIRLGSRRLASGRFTLTQATKTC